MDLGNLFLAGARHRDSRCCLRCPYTVELIVVRLMHPQHRFELPVGNRGVSQVHGVRALVGMVALERKDVRILATVDQKYESGTTVGPETGVNCRSVGAMAATADSPKR